MRLPLRAWTHVGQLYTAGVLTTDYAITVTVAGQGFQAGLHGGGVGVVSQGRRGRGAIAIGRRPATNYQSLSGSVTLAAGQSSATIDVTPFDANLAGPDQTVTLTLSLPDDGGYVIGSPSSDTVFITQDAPPGVTIAATTPTADEQTGSAGVFTVTRNSGLADDLPVAYSISGTAFSGAQFQQLSGTVVIPAGQASATIDVDPINVGQAFQPDTDPTVTLTLVPGGQNYTAVTPSTDTVTIDEDADATTPDPSPPMRRSL